MSRMIDEKYDRLTTVPTTIKMYREVVCMVVSAEAADSGKEVG
jgi:hypothetical protein